MLGLPSVSSFVSSVSAIFTNREWIVKEASLTVLNYTSDMKSYGKFTKSLHFAIHLLQPFLDPKAVTERIIEVVKNMEKVNILVGATYSHLLVFA